jgi:hypothetical protein
MISRFEDADAIADISDFAGAVGHRNAAVGSLDHPGDDGEVVKIQRTGQHPDQDLSGPGNRFGAAFDDDLFEPAWESNGSDLHGMLVSSSWNTDCEPIKTAQQGQRPCDHDRIHVSPVNGTPFLLPLPC